MPVNRGSRFGRAKVTEGRPVGEALREKGVGTHRSPAAALSAERKVEVDRVTITLPLPSPKLHAHATGHWAAKSKATKAARDLARETVEAYCPRPFRWEVARINLRFLWPDETRRDTLNAAQSCKPYIDGLADAGLIVGDHWRALKVGDIASDLDRANPRVEIIVERL